MQTQQTQQVNNQTEIENQSEIPISTPKMNLKTNLLVQQSLQNQGKTEEDIEFSLSPSGELKFKGDPSRLPVGILDDLLNQSSYRKSKNSSIEELQIATRSVSDLVAGGLFLSVFLVLGMLGYISLTTPNNSSNQKTQNLSFREQDYVRGDIGRCSTFSEQQSTDGNRARSKSGRR